MAKFDKVLIASDMDGTLLGKDHLISEKNMQAIEYFQQNGGTFTVATGRPPIAISFLLDGLNFTTPAVLLNGSVIYDVNAKKEVSSKMLGYDAVCIVEEVIKNFPDIGVEIFDIGDIYLVNPSEVSRRHFNSIHKEFKTTNFADVPPCETWLKVNFTCDDSELLAKLEDFIKQNYADSFQLCYSCKQFLEITNEKARKDHGVFEVADEYGFAREHIYTIGDNFNDLYMVKNAAKGFAPSNAEPEVQEAAFKVVSHHDDSAVADMIEFLDTIY
ncbi:MAG: Cof-type HAD-IIB family hydrolase [Clostridia bacterium]